MAYNNEWGEKAEIIAAEFLIARGYVVRETKWRSGPGRKREIDIIAQQGNVLVFVEVKARKKNSMDPVEAVDARKRQMMVKGADAYAGMQPHPVECRFDIISVVGNPESYTIEHIPDAFFSPLFSR